MKPVASKQRPSIPTIPLKVKMSSQGEIHQVNKLESARNTQKTPDIVRQMDIKAMKTSTDNKIDIYKTTPTRPHPVSPKPAQPSKAEPVPAKKNKPDVRSPVSPRSSQHLKKSFDSHKIESKREQTKTLSVNQKFTALTDTIDRRSKKNVPLLDMDCIKSERRPDLGFARGTRPAVPSMFASVLVTPTQKTEIHEPLPEFKKFVTDDNFLKDDKEHAGPALEKREMSFCNEDFLEGEAPTHEERENSFCEITSKQDASLLHSKTDFVDSFRSPVVGPAPGQAGSAATPTNALNNTQISFDKKREGTNLVLVEPESSMFGSMARLNELQKENQKNIANFFLLGSGVLPHPEEEKIEVILNKRLDRKQSSRCWKNDFGVDPGLNLDVPENSQIGHYLMEGPKNPFFGADLDSIEGLSPEPRSLRSSGDNPLRLNEVVDKKNFETFRHQKCLELASVSIFARKREAPAAKVAAQNYSFAQTVRNNSKSRFEELVLSAKGADCKTSRTQLRDGLPDAEATGYTSDPSLGKPTSLSSFEMVCPNCRMSFNKTSQKELIPKPPDEMGFDKPLFIEQRFGFPKRLNPLQMSNDVSRSFNGLEGLVKSSFSKTNSGSLELCLHGQTKAANVYAADGDSSPTDHRSTPSKTGSDTLSLSQANLRSEPPLKVLVSIFKKIVVFNTKCERVKEALFLNSPDIASRMAQSVGSGAHAKLSWQSLMEFLQRHKIAVHRQSFARLIFYVQSFVAGRDAQLAAINNFSFFNYLLTPKFMYSAEDLPSSPGEPPAAKDAEFTREEIAAVSDILKVVVHKIDYFAQSFKTIDSDFVQKMFTSLSKGGATVSRDDIVDAITANEAQIKVQDVCFVLDEFQSGDAGISWACFAEYFEKKKWKF